MAHAVEAEASATGSMTSSTLRQRQRRLRLVVGVAVAAAAVGWAAGSRLRSPADSALGERLTTPSSITAPLELRELSVSLVLRGDGSFAGATELTVDTAGGTDEAVGSRPVVTGALPAPGSQLDDGAVAVEVSGRPVFLLAGELPMYRTLMPGTEGRDVQQLEVALQRLGFLSGAVDDTFDGRTTAAIEAWYRDAGYEPASPGAEATDRLAAAQAQVTAANDALLSAEAALEAARQPPSGAQMAAARGEVDVAQVALDRAVADRDEAVANAPPADRERVRREHDVLVAEARNRLAVAQAALADLQAPPDTTLEQQAVDVATQALAVAEADLATAQGASGTRLPRGEVVFLPNLPRRVDQVHVALGAEPTGPVMTLSGSEVQVVSRLAPAEREQVAVGDQVRLDEENLGIDLSGTVVAVSDAPHPSGEAAGTYELRIRPEGTGATDLAGVNVRVTIPVQSSDGEVLAAPVAAVSTAADGESRVRIVWSDGSADDVVVRLGLSAEGYVAIDPVDEELRPGDEVVLGVR